MEKPNNTQIKKKITCEKENKIIKEREKEGV